MDSTCDTIQVNNNTNSSMNVNININRWSEHVTKSCGKLFQVGQYCLVWWPTNNSWSDHTLFSENFPPGIFNLFLQRKDTTNNWHWYWVVNLNHISINILIWKLDPQYCQHFECGQGQINLQLETKFYLIFIGLQSLNPFFFISQL